MAFDAEGKRYVAVFWPTRSGGTGARWVYSEAHQDGRKMPTNIAFGLPGQKKIYVTECEFGQLEVFDVEADGLDLWT
jgi:hypothetical protein